MQQFKSKLGLLELRKLQTNFPNVKINSSQEAAAFIRQFYTDDIGIFESFFVLLLNRANNTIAYAKISQGGVSSCVVDPKIIAKYAVDALASAAIVAHNHPSGNQEPSQHDKTMTHKLYRGLQFLEINLLDHIILTPENQYFSFADEGLLNPQDLRS